MRKSSHWIFWAVAAYILFQFTWWGIYLIDVNREILNLKTAIAADADSIAQYQKTFLRKKWMIIGEGLVFLAFIAFGLLKVRQNLLKETRNAKQRENFMLSVTHELKSPLTGIKLVLETLKRRVIPEEKREQLLGTALAETHRLHAMTDNILLSSRLERLSTNEEVFDISMSALLEEMRLQWPSKQDQERIEIDLSNDFTVRAEKSSLQAAVRNLIENALKYSPAHEKVQVLIGQNAERALAVQDHGLGIEDSEKEAIFERFYRVGDEATRTSKGTGLGLFIVAQVAKQLGAKLQILDVLPKGSSFKMTFPKT